MKWKLKVHSNVLFSKPMVELKAEWPKKSSYTHPSGTGVSVAQCLTSNLPTIPSEMGYEKD